MTGPASSRDRLHGLYVIIDPKAARGRDEVSVVAEAIEGGARLIQLRDKTREKGLQLPIAREIRRACRKAGALFFINDHVD
ncbi:MAG TPA: thiamine phosphate synthase, partial [Dehalococcoidia bacterium]|nr:thiamine phosphate synthase [Dehalococcoidia bacterium]